MIRQKNPPKNNNKKQTNKQTNKNKQTKQKQQTNKNTNMAISGAGLIFPIYLYRKHFLSETTEPISILLG